MKYRMYLYFLSIRWKQYCDYFVVVLSMLALAFLAYLLRVELAKDGLELPISFFLGLPLLLLPTGVYWKTCFSDLVFSIRFTCFLQFFLQDLIFFMIDVTPSFDFMVSDLTVFRRVTPTVLLLNFIPAITIILLLDLFSAQVSHPMHTFSIVMYEISVKTYFSYGQLYKDIL